MNCCFYYFSFLEVLVLKCTQIKKMLLISNISIIKKRCKNKYPHFANKLT